MMGMLNGWSRGVSGKLRDALRALRHAAPLLALCLSAAAQTPVGDALTFGIPGSVEDSKSKGYLVRHPYFWVNVTKLGTTEAVYILEPGNFVNNVRRDSGASFMADVMAGQIFQISSRLYSRSGMDRGHLCMADAQEFDAGALKDSMVMTNIVAMPPGINRVLWRAAEMAVKAMALSGRRLLVKDTVIYSNGFGWTGGALPSAYIKTAVDLESFTVTEWEVRNGDKPGFVRKAETLEGKAAIAAVQRALTIGDYTLYLRGDDGERWRRFSTGGAEDNGMKPFIDMLKFHVPPVIIYTWLDCNMETANGEQIRRFCKSLYVTPSLEFKALDPEDARGICAQLAKNEKGEKYLRLVNNSPYPSDGLIQFDGEAYDTVFDTALVKDGNGFSLSLLPCDMRVIKLSGGGGSVRCLFSYDDSVKNEITGITRTVLSSSVLTKKIPRGYLDILADALKANDAFLMYNTLEDFEVKSRLEKYSFKSLELQGKLLADLKRNGKCFINCACLEEHTDPSGNRWLPDQEYNGLAYGNEHAEYADRGDLPIGGTDRPRVYQTEAHGSQVYYHIPLPNGVYNVWVHMAETWFPNKEKGRVFSVKAGDCLREDINPVVKAGGFAKACAEEFKNIHVKDGLLSIELKGGVGVSGIEIRRAD